jgi:hypothetical protein
MPLASRLALAVLLALTGPTLCGCSTSTELRRVRTPREGVTMAYALEPGQSFEGTLRLGNTRAVEGLEDPLGQTATCEVSMAVVGVSPKGVEIRATFTSVELEWDLPPAATYSSEELLELAHEQLRGMQVSFVVRPDGRVQALPAPPADAPPELYEVIETMLLGLDAFFVPLPPQPLARGDAWSERLQHTTGDGLSQALEHEVRLDASYEHRDDELLLLRQLTIVQERREQRPGDGGPVTVEREVQAQMLFATTGFPAQLDRETREFDPVRGVVFRKVRAEWSRTRGLVPELVAPPSSGDVQMITDPCNPDYVGPRLCEETEAPAIDPPASDDGEAPGEPSPSETDDEASSDAEDDAPPEDAAPAAEPSPPVTPGRRSARSPGR